MEGVKEVVDVLQDESKLYKWPAIVAIELLALATMAAIDALILKDVVGNVYVRLAIFIGVPVLVFLFWNYKKNAVPAPTIDESSKALKIAMTIAPDGAEAKTLLRNDFADAFRKQIKASGLEDIVDCHVADEKVSNRVIDLIQTLEAHRAIPRKPKVIDSTREDWQKIHSVLKADFYFWGKLYQFGGKYVLDFKGYVDENLEPELNAEILKEYDALCIQKRILDEGEALTKIPTEAKYFYIVARFVIGVVAFFSGKREEALRLDKSLEKDLQTADDFDSKDTIIHLLKKRLSAQYFLSSRILMSEGKSAEAEEELKVAKEYDPENPNVYMFAAANDYLFRRNWSSAWDNIQQVKKLAPVDQSSWKYSAAFLLMARADFVQALKYYDEITNSSYRHEEFTVRQVIEYNRHILSQEPKFYPARFIIALVQGAKQKRYDEAIKGMDDFMKSVGKSHQYQILRAAAKKYREAFKAEKNIQASADRLAVVEN